jgi:predicted nucleic-acid-binding protein
MSSPLIGIDTNIIVRLLTRDDETQFALARGLVANASPDKPLCVNVVTMTETLWVLERRLGLPVEKARSLLSTFLSSPEITVPVQSPFRSWKAAFQHSHVGWTDIVVASINAETGCSHTFTFDKRAAKSVPGMELLT